MLNLHFQYYVITLGTIHLRRRQIFTTFDPYPPHMEVKVAVLNTISQNFNFLEVKLIPYVSLCLENYLDQIFVKF